MKISKLLFWTGIIIAVVQLIPQEDNWLLTAKMGLYTATVIMCLAAISLQIEKVGGRT